MKAGVSPAGAGAGARDLSALRSVGSTGSPLAPEGFRWIYDELGSDTWLFSTSGGTDVCTAFVGGVPLLPVYEGELQARSLGCDVRAFDEDGRELIDAVGELVITQPLPSMPLSFWNDAGGERLREAYFEMYPGVWRHGDWIEITSRGTAVIYGRSDSTINRGGVRMGTSEIYSAVLALDAVVDALVVDVDGWMVLFVVLRDGAELDDDLRARASRGASARTARRATCPTTSTPSPRSRARCRASCSRCRSSGSSPARIRRARPAATRSPTRPRWTGSRRSRGSGRRADELQPGEEEAAPARAGGLRRAHGGERSRRESGIAARARGGTGRRRPRHPSRLEVRDGVPRPDAIWAPFPLTEIGMAVGIVIFLIGFAGAPALLLAGVGVLVVVVAELCLREHFAGFRSHSILLALLPVTVVHLAIVLLVSEDWRGPPALAVDLAVAGALAWWLQQRFRTRAEPSARALPPTSTISQLRERSRASFSTRSVPGAAVDDVGAAADGADRVGARARRAGDRGRSRR